MGLKEIALVNIQWIGQPVEKATLETEHDMQSRYPDLFVTPGIILILFEDGCLFKRE